MGNIFETPLKGTKLYNEVMDILYDEGDYIDTLGEDIFIHVDGKKLEVTGIATSKVESILYLTGEDNIEVCPTARDERKILKTILGWYS